MEAYLVVVLQAARIAVTVFQEEMTKRLPEIDDIRKAGKFLVKAFMHAHTRILQAPLKVRACDTSRSVC